jgi:predicted RNA binding protein YcfA (HicA-like mRNA interferase family)
VVTARQIFRLLNRLGSYGEKRCGNGSHRKFVRTDGKGKPVVIPYHPDDRIALGTLKQIIESLVYNEGCSEEVIIEMLNDC